MFLVLWGSMSIPLCFHLWWHHQQYHLRLLLHTRGSCIITSAPCPIIATADLSSISSVPAAISSNEPSTQHIKVIEMIIRVTTTFCFTITINPTNTSFSQRSHNDLWKAGICKDVCVCVSKFFQYYKRIKMCAGTVESAQAIYKEEPQRTKDETAETRKKKGKTRD